jgi:hypothetical protein
MIAGAWYARLCAMYSERFKWPRLAAHRIIQ